MDIEKKRKFDVIGISVNTTTDMSENCQGLQQIWCRFFKEGIASKISRKIDDDIICVYDNYKQTQPGVYQVRATVGYKVEASTKIPQGMVLTSINEGAYQKFLAKGKMPDCIINKWASIWKDQDHLNRKFETDFEVYTEKSNDMDNGEMEIFIGVSN
ncbi:MAG: GyrI-like domain-containing protein [bacterium]|nr:GyrI-like domain-containing protein [bacterium]